MSGRFVVIFAGLFFVASTLNTTTAHLTAPPVLVQLLIGCGIVAAFLGLGYLFVWKG